MLKAAVVSSAVLIALVLGVWLLPGTAQEGVSGSWRLRVQFSDHTVETGSLVLIQNGETLAGTYTGPPRIRTQAGGWDYGSAGLTGSVTGDLLSFSVSLAGDEIAYTGALQNGWLTGHCQYGQLGGTCDWTAIRPSVWDF